ncbi:hypothetical protein [Streptomyces sp. A5-4]|uniref:glycine-rich domain-containing protein n=1 Tax=Streptomyces sp. A5-4 TaxID=3384771 RepID=UPI003DA9841D
MARCGCQGGCSCAVEGVGAIEVTGNGSSGAPFAVSVDLAQLLHAGQGIVFNPVTGTISVKLSTNPGNASTFGTDDGVFTFGGGSGGPIAVCTEYFQTDSDGKLCLKPGSMGLRERLIYAPGSYTFTPADYPWLVRLRVQVQGGGGGGQGATAPASQLIARPGASGGAYAESILSVTDVPAPVPITVGVGGAGGAGATNANGGNGGNSSFGTLVVGPGGAGGSSGFAAGTAVVTSGSSAGATGGVGQIVVNGGGGGGSFRLSAAECLSGAGGDSHLGIGGYPRRTNGSGTSPSGYGSGAGGAVATNNFTTNGTNGAPGIVIVELYG